MTRTIFGTAAALALALPAMAGGIADPVMPPAAIVADVDTAPSQEWVIPLLLLAVAAVALSD
ncbi:hypothetical protein DXV76_10445 [Rhodobacteraceae bacterium CCMM004]|nr:hypothetical protein DXV76_10445 [Rhodobacteraceae bacterium CCMM004]